MSGQSGGRLRLSKLNEQLTCTLCTGYLIDATTIIECLHSFCRSCIVKYLEVNKYCPICEVLVHKSKPLLNIRPDHTLQDIVYKLVPSCYQNEMRCRREFYSKHPEGKNSTMSPESRGEPIESHIYSPDESLSLSLEYFSPDVSSDCEDSKEIVTKPLPRRYLRCPAAVTIFHLQKLIRAKYGLSEAHRVDVMYKEEPLSGSYTLMDVMYIYHWRRKVPLHLSYRIFESSPKRIKLSEDNNEFKQSLSNTGISPAESKEEQPTKRGWKEVQLKISETGVMSVTDISSPDSKKSTKVKEIDDQNSSDLLENIETLDKSVNKPKIVLEDEPIAKSSKQSTSKTKNLTENEEKKIPQESKRIVSKRDEKDVKETKDSKLKEVKEAKMDSKIKEEKEFKEKKEKKEVIAKKEKRENREELEITSRVPEEKVEKEIQNQKKEKEKNPSAGSKIDALSAKLQFLPKVGQVNNTYSKKTLKEKKIKSEVKKDLKNSKTEPSELEGSSKTEVSKSTDVPKSTEVSKSPEVSKNPEVFKSPEISKSLSNSTSLLTSAPSISSEKPHGTCLQQALTSIGKQIRPEGPKSLLSQFANQKSNFRNNSPSSESLASIGLNVSTTINQGSNFGFVMPDLGMSPGSKTQNPPVSQVPVSQVPSSSQIAVQSSSHIQTSSQKPIPQFNIQPSMSIYSISGKNLYNQSSKSSKPDFEITSYPIPPCPDTIPIALMKPSIRKHEVIAKGTNLNEICAKIGTSGSKINDICAKIGENSKEKIKTEIRRPDLPDLLKITKSPSSEFLKHIPNMNVPIYTPSNSSERKNSVPSQKISPKKTPHGYKTLKDPPKPWNPTLSKNNYVAVKNHNDGGTSKPILSKPARIFKMRNMPRYLGNPASGVKPMYGVGNEKEKEATKNSMIPNTMSMMKIDPKTLSPITTVNSPIVSPPPYSPNARSYQNSPFSREMRNSGSPISPRNSPVMLSTNPFIPSPTPNTNPRLIYSNFPPPFPDASRFPNPLIRTPVGIPPPSAFHSSLPPSINKLYQRSSYSPQTSGYSSQTSGYNQPPTVQRIPPTQSQKSNPSFNLKDVTENNLKEAYNLSKLDADLSEKRDEKVKEKESLKIDLESKVNGDIDLEEEAKQNSGKDGRGKEMKSVMDLNQSLKESKESKESNQPLQESTETLMVFKEAAKEGSKETKEINESSKESPKRPKEISKESNLNESLIESLKEGSKDSKELKESKELKDSKEGQKNLQENLSLERSKDLPEEKIEEVEKEIQGKKTEIQRNKAES